MWDLRVWGNLLFLPELGIRIWCSSWEGEVGDDCWRGRSVDHLEERSNGTVAGGEKSCGRDRRVGIRIITSFVGSGRYELDGAEGRHYWYDFILLYFWGCVIFLRNVVSLEVECDQLFFWIYVMVRVHDIWTDSPLIHIAICRRNERSLAWRWTMSIFCPDDTAESCSHWNAVN